MTRHARLLITLSLLGIIGLLACDGPNATPPLPGAPSKSVMVQASLGDAIDALISSGFPKGRATAIAAQWDQVLRALAREPRVTLKGKLVPGSSGRAELVKLVDYVEKKTTDAIPPVGEQQAHFVARLVLDMSLYVYGGPNTPVPSVSPTSDVALKLVQPGTTDTLVTPAQQAGVVFPPGSVAEPTVVVITPDSAYYPANCSGPLVTHLCQYPTFYHFNVFPDVKLGIPAKVQVCHIDAGTFRRPLADHDRFRIAHEKPADTANYTPGSTIVDNVEILALTPMTVTNCQAGGGTQYTPPPTAIGSFGNTPLGRITNVAFQLVHRASAAAKGLFVPRDAYAIDVGGGGLVEEFSMFGVVDPLGQADIAQLTAPDSRFRALQTEVYAGEAIPVTSWSIRNAGSATSDSVFSVVRLATDSLMNTPVTTIPVERIGGLVPGATHAFAAAQIVTLANLAPGTYYIGTIATPAGADSTAADDKVSVRITVMNPSPVYSMTDLGALGSKGAKAFAINAGGVIVGQSTSSNLTPRGFVWTAGVMSDIGSLGGGVSDTVAARGINDLGEIVGTSKGATFPGRHAFLRTAGAMRDLGITAGFTSTFALGINNSGDIVGTTETIFPPSAEVGNSHALRWPARGSLMDLGTLGGTYNAQFPAVNVSGQAAGVRDVGNVVTTNVVFSPTSPAVPVLDLDNPPTPGGGSILSAINDSATVVGFSTALMGSTVHAYLFKAGMPAALDLGTIAGNASNALGINNSGVVAGNSTIATGAARFPFVWNRRVGMVALPIPAGAISGSANAINRSGVIVGNVVIRTSVQGPSGVGNVDVPHAIRWTPSP